MNAWQMSIWCWVLFVVGMVLMLPALLFGLVGLAVEQLLTWAAFAYGMYLSMAVIRGGDKRLARNGVPGTAVVLSAQQTNTVVQEGEFTWNAPYVWKYGLEVTVPGWQPYKTMLYICASLSEGETIPVRVARFNRKRVTIDPVAYNQQYGKGVRQSSSASSRGSDDLADLVASTQALAAQLGSVKAAPAQPDVADELEKLARLRNQGILTDAEFAAEKAKLLAR